MVQWWETNCASWRRQLSSLINLPVRWVCLLFGFVSLLFPDVCACPILFANLRDPHHVIISELPFFYIYFSQFSLPNPVISCFVFFFLTLSLISFWPCEYILDAVWYVPLVLISRFACAFLKTFFSQKIILLGNFSHLFCLDFCYYYKWHHQEEYSPKHYISNHFSRKSKFQIFNLSQNHTRKLLTITVIQMGSRNNTIWSVCWIDSKKYNSHSKQWKFYLNFQ